MGLLYNFLSLISPQWMKYETYICLIPSGSFELWLIADMLCRACKKHSNNYQRNAQYGRIDAD